MNRLREIYESLDDSKILHLKKYEYDELGEDAKDILGQEINKRDLVLQIRRFQELERIDYTDGDIEDIIEKYRNSACPVCGKKEHKLNLYIIDEFYFVIVFFIFRKKQLFGCQECILYELDSLNKKLFYLSLISPLQLLASIGPISANKKMARQIEIDYSVTKEFKKYVKDNLHQVAEIIGWKQLRAE